MTTKDNIFEEYFAVIAYSPLADSDQDNYSSNEITPFITKELPSQTPPFIFTAFFQYFLYESSQNKMAVVFWFQSSAAKATECLWTVECGL